MRDRRPDLVHQDVGRALAGGPDALQDLADLCSVDVVPWGQNAKERLEEDLFWDCFGGGFAREPITELTGWIKLAV